MFVWSCTTSNTCDHGKLLAQLDSLPKAQTIWPSYDLRLSGISRNFRTALNSKYLTSRVRSSSFGSIGRLGCSLLPITLTLSSNSGASIFRRTKVFERSTWPPKSNALFERIFLLHSKTREKAIRWDCPHLLQLGTKHCEKLLERLNERGRQEYWRKFPSADLPIFPSHAQEPWLDSFFRHLKRFEGKSMVLPDNWDNLTAKIRFRVLPNYISVYGKSSNVQARSLHGFSDKQIFELGAPRFNVSFSKPETLRKTGTVKTVAYLGYFQKHDELKQPKDLSTIIHSRADLQEHQWLYRRHPARENWREALPAPFQSANLGSKTLGSLPDLNTHYLSEIWNYDLDIGLPSS